MDTNSSYWAPNSWKARQDRHVNPARWLNPRIIHMTRISGNTPYLLFHFVKPESLLCAKLQWTRCVRAIRSIAPNRLLQVWTEAEITAEYFICRETAIKKDLCISICVPCCADLTLVLISSYSLELTTIAQFLELLLFLNLQQVCDNLQRSLKTFLVIMSWNAITKTLFKRGLITIEITETHKQPNKSVSLSQSILLFH